MIKLKKHMKHVFGYMAKGQGTFRAQGLLHVEYKYIGKHEEHIEQT